MRECSVCFEGYKNGVKCFGSCSLVICIGCFNKILKVNVVDDIEYSCPACRNTCIKNLDKRFSKFLNNNKKCLKRIVNLLEQSLEQKTRPSVDHQWIQFNHDIEQRIHDRMINLTPEELTELTGVEWLPR